MKRWLMALWVGVLFFAVGCSREEAGCFTPLGDPISSTVALDAPVEAVRILDRIDVRWSPNSTAGGPRLTWLTGEGTEGGMSAELDEGTLLIQDLNQCRWVRPLNAVPEVLIEGVDCRDWLLEGQGAFTMVDTLHGGDLRMVGDEMSGSVRLLFDGDTLQVRMPNGIGHVEVSGRARRIRAFRSGFGDLDARHCEVSQAMVHHAGLGEVHLHASDYLYLEVAGAGHVFLYEEPAASNIQFLQDAVGTVTLVE